MSDETKTNPAFWDCSDDCEMLSHTTISDAVEAWADGIHPDPLPETVTVYGWNPIELPTVERLADDLLDATIERLDEDYGSPDDTTEATKALRAAALAFAAILRDEYHVWRCEPATSEVVRVADHVPAEWLTPAVEVPS